MSKLQSIMFLKGLVYSPVKMKTNIIFLIKLELDFYVKATAEINDVSILIPDVSTDLHFVHKRAPGEPLRNRTKY